MSKAQGACLLLTGPKCRFAPMRKMLNSNLKGASWLFSGPRYQCLPIRRILGCQIQRGNHTVISARISIITYTTKNESKPEGYICCYQGPDINLHLYNKWTLNPKGRPYCSQSLYIYIYINFDLYANKSQSQGVILLLPRPEYTFSYASNV